MLLPAYTLVNQPTVGNTTIVTNVVPSIVQPGAAISWPTIISTNYQPQWTASLTPNTVWSNLVGQITGNGTTNVLFDPFGQYQQKFYNILQIGGILTNSVQAGIARGAAISWFASNNVPYQVQWSSNDATWNNLGNSITGNGSSNTISDTSGQAGHGFYQVLSIQQFQQ
jgi:hypothetical protein